jgi:hypothetical protein
MDSSRLATSVFDLFRIRLQPYIRLSVELVRSSHDGDSLTPCRSTYRLCFLAVSLCGFWHVGVSVLPDSINNVCYAIVEGGAFTCLLLTSLITFTD